MMNKDIIFLTDEQKKDLSEYFAHPNRMLFRKLAELVYRDPAKRKFRLERLNDGGIKENTLCPFAVPVRAYARKVLRCMEQPAGSIWRKLAADGDILHERDGKRLSRAAIIALAFVFSLSSSEVDELMDASSYYRLYARSIPDAALIYALEIYKNSEEYRRFENASVALSETEFIGNYWYYIRLFARYDSVSFESGFSGTLVEVLTSAAEGAKPQRVTWTLNHEKLKTVSEPGGDSTLNLTRRCMEELKEAVSEGLEADRGDLRPFEEFVEDNRKALVQNRERALRYIFVMLNRYQERERIVADKGKFGSKAEERIDLSTLSRRFTVFMDCVNLYSAGEMFLRHYISCFNGEYEEDIEAFALDCLPEDTDDETAVGAFYERVRFALSLTDSKYKRKKTDAMTPLDDSERGLVCRIIEKERTLSGDMSLQFKRIISGEADVPRLFFIFFFLFTAPRGKEKNRAGFAEDELQRLDEWLAKSGFPGIIGDPLEDFARAFLLSQMILPESVRYTNRDGSFSYVYEQAEDKQREFFFDTFNYILTRDLSIDDLIRLDLDASSLYEEEFSMLPTWRKKAHGSVKKG